MSKKDVTVEEWSEFIDQTFNDIGKVKEMYVKRKLFDVNPYLFNNYDIVEDCGNGVIKLKFRE